MEDNDQSNMDNENDAKGMLSGVKGLVPGNAGSPPPKVTFVNAFSAIFNGLGIGLLLGVLLGLSVSPVVSGVIATISSLLAVLVGLNEKLLDPLKSLRIGSFGLFSVVGILIGLYFRANDPFAPTLLERMEEYRSIGYSEEEAREMITGFIRADSGRVIRQANVLYSSSIQLDACDFLVYADISTPVSEIINTFQSAGGIWKEFAESFKADLSPEIQGKCLLLLRDSFCAFGTSGQLQTGNLSAVKSIRPTDSLSAMEESFTESGEIWQTIVGKIRDNFPVHQRKSIYLAMAKVLQL